YCDPCLGDIVEGKVPGPAGAATQSTQGNQTSQNSQSTQGNRAPVHDTLGGTNPGAAFALGLIPGVGAIYNGEFVKAAVHVLIFGMLVSLADATDAALFALGT